MAIPRLFKRFRCRFLDKVSLVFSLTISIILVTAAIITTQLVTSILVEKDLQYDRFVLVNINDFIKQKFDNIHQIITMTNLRGVQPSDLVFEFLKAKERSNTADYVASYGAFVRHANSMFSNDPDIESIQILKIADQKIYRFTSAGVSFKEASPARDREMIGLSESPLQTIAVKQSCYDADAKSYCYSLLSNLKTTIELVNVATLSFNMRTSGIAEIIGRYYNAPHGTFYVLTNKNEVIYDSSETFYGGRIEASQLKPNGPGPVVFNGEYCFVNSY